MAESPDYTPLKSGFQYGESARSLNRICEPRAAWQATFKLQREGQAVKDWSLIRSILYDIGRTAIIYLACVGALGIVRGSDPVPDRWMIVAWFIGTALGVGLRLRKAISRTEPLLQRTAGR